MSKNESIKTEYMVALNSILTNKNNIEIDIAYYKIHKMKLTQLREIFDYLHIKTYKIGNEINKTGNRFSQQTSQDIILPCDICLNVDIIKKFNLIQFSEKLMFDDNSDYMVNVKSNKMDFKNSIKIQDLLFCVKRNYNKLNDNEIDGLIDDIITYNLVLWINHVTTKLRDFRKNEYLNKLNVSTFFLDNDCSDCVINICKLVEIKNIVLKEVETILKDIFMVEFNIEDIKLKTGSEITELLTDKIKIVNLIIRGLYMDLYKLT